tara:strand:+ start:244 stop:507 length:264 start_codon:yes stop_codon:yes gene_type:complete
MTKSREWLLYNAVLAWLHSYAGYDGLDLIPQYQQLKKELEFEYEEVDEQPDNTKTRKRGRPAKRQRKKETSSNPASTEKSKTTNQET